MAIFQCNEGRKGKEQSIIRRITAMPGACFKKKKKVLEDLYYNDLFVQVAFNLILLFSCKLDLNGRYLITTYITETTKMYLLAQSLKTRTVTQ